MRLDGKPFSKLNALNVSPLSPFKGHR